MITDMSSSLVSSFELQAWPPISRALLRGCALQLGGKAMTFRRLDQQPELPSSLTPEPEPVWPKEAERASIKKKEGPLLRRLYGLKREVGSGTSLVRSLLISLSCSFSRLSASASLVPSFELISSIDIFAFVNWHTHTRMCMRHGTHTRVL